MKPRVCGKAPVDGFRVLEEAAEEEMEKEVGAATDILTVSDKLRRERSVKRRVSQWVMLSLLYTVEMNSWGTVKDEDEVWFFSQGPRPVWFRLKKRKCGNQKTWSAFATCLIKCIPQKL